MEQAVKRKQKKFRQSASRNAVEASPWEEKDAADQDGGHLKVGEKKKLVTRNSFQTKKNEEIFGNPEHKTVYKRNSLAESYIARNSAQEDSNCEKLGPVELNDEHLKSIEDSIKAIKKKNTHVSELNESSESDEYFSELDDDYS